MACRDARDVRSRHTRSAHSCRAAAKAGRKDPDRLDQATSAHVFPVFTRRGNRHVRAISREVRRGVRRNRAREATALIDPPIAVVLATEITCGYAAGICSATSVEASLPAATTNSTPAASSDAIKWCMRWIVVDRAGRPRLMLITRIEGRHQCCAPGPSRGRP